MLRRAPTACWETVGNKRETSVESGGPENPKHTARQSETSAGQVGDKCRTMQFRASTAYWETSGRQLQNHGAQSTRSASHSGPGHLQHTGRQVGDKSRIRRSKASTPFFESGEPGTQLGESWSSAEPGRGRQLGDRCRLLKAPTARETSVDSCGPEHPQRTSRQWESSGGQPGDKCGRKGGDKCRITCGPEHPQSQKQVGDKRGTNAEPCGPKHPQTSAIQVQNYAAQSTHGVLRDSGGLVGDKENKFRFRWPRPPWAYMGEKCRFMRLKAPTAHCETGGEKW